MLQLSNGAIFPGFILYFLLYIIVRLMPSTFAKFHDKHPLISYPAVNFNLPFDVNEENWPKVKRVGGRTFLLSPVWMLSMRSAMRKGFMDRGNFLTAELQVRFFASAFAAF